MTTERSKGTGKPAGANTKGRGALLALAAAGAVALAATGNGIAATERITITSRAARPSSQGPAETFTGKVMVEPLFAATKSTRAMAVSVAFTRRARTAWHSHPAGQTLIVTAGRGWVQEWGGARREIMVGDVIWTPPGVKHWHGATNRHAMTHIAVLEHVDGKVVDWMEQVTDQQYGE